MSGCGLGENEHGELVSCWIISHTWKPRVYHLRSPGTPQHLHTFLFFLLGHHCQKAIPHPWAAFLWWSCQPINPTLPCGSSTNLLQLFSSFKTVCYFFSLLYVSLPKVEYLLSSNLPFPVDYEVGHLIPHCKEYTKINKNEWRWNPRWVHHGPCASALTPGACSVFDSERPVYVLPSSWLFSGKVTLLIVEF